MSDHSLRLRILNLLGKAKEGMTEKELQRAIRMPRRGMTFEEEVTALTEVSKELHQLKLEHRAYPAKTGRRWIATSRGKNHG